MTAQTILISGATSGLGRAMALEFARRGHHVFAGARELDSDETRALLRDAPAPITPVGLELTDDTSVNAAIEQVVAAGRGLDVLINNAGIISPGLVEGFSLETMRRVFEVNVFGTMRLTLAALPVMRRQKSGVIVTITSRQGRLATPFTALYAGTKFALEALMEGLRYEAGQLGIDSVIIEPGAFPTRLGERMVRPDAPERLLDYGDLAQMPMRMGARLAAEHAKPDAPRPADFAARVADLVETPTGERPLRTAIDPQMQASVDAVNATYLEVMTRALAAFGMSHLAQPRPATNAAQAAWTSSS